jgi:hypothetical protein
VQKRAALTVLPGSLAAGQEKFRSETSDWTFPYFSRPNGTELRPFGDITTFKSRNARMAVDETPHNRAETLSILLHASLTAPHSTHAFLQP